MKADFETREKAWRYFGLHEWRNALSFAALKLAMMECVKYPAARDAAYISKIKTRWPEISAPLAYYSENPERYWS